MEKRYVWSPNCDGCGCDPLFFERLALEVYVCRDDWDAFVEKVGQVYLFGKSSAKRI